jgi:hypothetical protein
VGFVGAWSPNARTVGLWARSLEVRAGPGSLETDDESCARHPKTACDLFSTVTVSMIGLSLGAYVLLIDEDSELVVLILASLPCAVC